MYAIFWSVVAILVFIYLMGGLYGVLYGSRGEYYQIKIDKDKRKNQNQEENELGDIDGSEGKERNPIKNKNQEEQGVNKSQENTEEGNTVRERKPRFQKD